ncbi:hypothetical protein SAMN06295879_1183 [Agreia bicolorata]|uniref:Alanine-rich protein n=1 Tax=Agreia bicolorata TaxID=110935 RepID=A0A1T4XJS6_9MICO|nr:hypothetical protein [Agreia bicolorata]SKA89365.1 hypothetical protein SAMN06295879_1183 [Agreia bicolorata]
MREKIDALWCAYPWDLLGDPSVVERVTDSGASGVAIAAAYHSVRAATPLHPTHRIVDAAHAALYAPVRELAWAGMRLRPVSGAAWAGDDAFARAASIAREGGLSVEAWIVLTHSSIVGSGAPDLCVTSAYDETYPYALCPSSPEVRAYATRLVEEVIAAAPLDGVMLEACGSLGVDHLGHHEKTQGADWSALDSALLSVCFCLACVDELGRIGADVDRLRAQIRAAIGVQHASKTRVEDVLSDAAAVLAVRTSARHELLGATVAAARRAGIRQITVHASPDPWATGPFSALFDEAGSVDALVLPGNELLGASAERLAELRALAGGTPLAGYFAALPPETPATISERWPAAIASVDRAYLYHLGLLSAQRLSAVGSATRSARVG